MNSSIQSFHHILIKHCNSQKFLSRVNQDILYNYVLSMLYTWQCEPLIVGGYTNHMHVVVKVNPEISLHQLFKRIIESSTEFLERERNTFSDFQGWDSSPLAISFHPDQKEDIINVVKEQFNYHRNNTLEAEIKELF